MFFKLSVAAALASVVVAAPIVVPGVVDTKAVANAVAFANAVVQRDGTNNHAGGSVTVGGDADLTAFYAACDKVAALEGQATTLANGINPTNAIAQVPVLVSQLQMTLAALNAQGFAQSAVGTIQNQGEASAQAVISRLMSFTSATQALLNSLASKQAVIANSPVVGSLQTLLGSYKQAADTFITGVLAAAMSDADKQTITGLMSQIDASATQALQAYGVTSKDPSNHAGGSVTVGADADMTAFYAACDDVAALEAQAMTLVNSLTGINALAQVPVLISQLKSTTNALNVPGFAQSAVATIKTQGEAAAQDVISRLTSFTKASQALLTALVNKKAVVTNGPLAATIASMLKSYQQAGDSLFTGVLAAAMSDLDKQTVSGLMSQFDASTQQGVHVYGA